MILIQIALPVFVMAGRFNTLHRGEEFRLEVAPVDPYDAFRGRYVAIGLNQNVLSEAVKEDNGHGLYGVLNTDARGFAYVERISVKKPLNEPYIKGSYKYGEFILPLDRYYMEEKAAPEAERLYWENAGKNAYITVRVKNGDAVISGLYLDGIKIEEYIKEKASL